MITCPPCEAAGSLTPSMQADIGVEADTENEHLQVCFSSTAKLLRFCHGRWKERGTGRATLVRGSVTGRRRFLMRHDSSNKILADHAVDRVPPYCDLQPHESSSKIWVWTACDYAEGVCSVEKFALKFRDPDAAAAFQLAFSQEHQPALLSEPPESHDASDLEDQLLAERVQAVLAPREQHHAEAPSRGLGRSDGASTQRPWP